MASERQNRPTFPERRFGTGAATQRAVALKIKVFKLGAESFIEIIFNENNILNMIKLIIIASIILQLTGCASILNENRQAINVRTSCSNKSIPETCVAENSKGNWRFTTPAEVIINNDIYGLKITCKSPYTPQHTAEASSMPNLAFAGNILLGGIIGATFDIANSSGFKYPSDIEIINPFCKQP